jgi:Kinetochore protein Mis14 like
MGCPLYTLGSFLLVDYEPLDLNLVSEVHRYEGEFEPLLAKLLKTRESVPRTLFSHYMDQMQQLKQSLQNSSISINSQEEAHMSHPLVASIETVLYEVEQNALSKETLDTCVSNLNLMNTAKKVRHGLFCCYYLLLSIAM